MAGHASYSAILVLTLTAMPKSGSADYIQGIIDNCFACHRHPQQTNGLPVIEGRNSQELNQLLLDYKYGRQPATLMPRILKALSDSEIQAIASALSQQPTAR